MYIEDLLRSGVNVAAEITTKDAYGFQEICQMFAKKQICQKICQKEEEDWREEYRNGISADYQRI